MGTKRIRLDERVYRRVSAYKREDGTYSEAIDRLIRGPSLRDLAGVFDEEQVTGMREAIDEADREEAEEGDCQGVLPVVSRPRPSVTAAGTVARAFLPVR